MTFQVIKNPHNLLCGKSYEEVLEAVKKDGALLKYIHGGNQSEELCLVAVRQNGDLLQFVKLQTEEIVKAALAQCDGAKQYVDDKFLYLFPDVE